MTNVSNTTLERMFVHCPRCGARGLRRLNRKAVLCGACGLEFYFNIGIAVGAIIRDARGRVLLVRRLNSPGKGKLAVPGGFVEYDETAEAAVRREVREELNLTVSRADYLGTFPNRYRHGGIVYRLLDVFYVCTVKRLAALKLLEEVAEVVFCAPGAVPPGEFAFRSNARAVQLTTLTSQNQEE